MPAHEVTWRESLARLGKAWEVPDLRRRLLFVAGMFLLYIVGLHVPAPFIKEDALKGLLQGMLGFIDILAGGALGGATGKLSILALGIIPYINASIIMQLLGIAVPQIQRMQKEGEAGRKKLSEYTRWGTVILAIVQASGLTWYLRSTGAIDAGIVPVGMAMAFIVLVMAAGTSFLMWMGERITDRGIGNGVSLIIFGGIMMRLPFTMAEMYNQVDKTNVGFAIVTIAVLLAVFVAIVGGITWVQQAVRQIPVQHAKRVVGSRVFSSANTYLPLKVVTAGVIPIIFAISVVMLPGQLAGFLWQSPATAPWWVEAMRIISPGYSGTALLWNGIPFGQFVGGGLYFALVVFFTYFYTAVVYNVQDIADNLKKQGSFVPGLRPGKQTEKYIDMVLTRITFAGAIFLGVVALLPYIVPALLHGTGGGSAQSFGLWGGTSLLIVVGVALETMKQLEAHLVMRHYDGFIKSSR